MFQWMVNCSDVTKILTSTVTIKLPDEVFKFGNWDLVPHLLLKAKLEQPLKVKLSLFIFVVSSVYCHFIAQKHDYNFFLAALHVAKLFPLSFLLTVNSMP